MLSVGGVELHGQTRWCLVLAKYIVYAIREPLESLFAVVYLEQKEDSVRRMKVYHIFPARHCISVVLLILLCLVVCACDAPFSAPAANPSPTATQAPCTASVQQPGDSIKTISSGGLKRSFLLHLPPAYGKYLQPLVIGYHGYSW